MDDESHDKASEPENSSEKNGAGNQPEEKGLEARLFIVGLGQTGREVLYRLLENIPVVGIDIEERKLEAVRERIGEHENLTLLRRDGTSRLTWRDLDLSADDTVVSVTRRDDVNIEVGTVVRNNFGIRRMIGLIHSTQRADEYEKAGIETVNRAKVLASFMETRIFRDKRTALNIGLGQGEIMEVPIMPGSSAVGRPLKSFGANPWLVGAIYRKDRLIVPHGNSVIREGDRILLIGEPHILSSIADFFRVGEPEFPLQYGLRIGVLADNVKDDVYQAMVSESNYLANHSKATSIVLLSLPEFEEPDVSLAEDICGNTDLSCSPAYFADGETEAWPRLLQTQDFGCLVLGLRKFGLLRRLGLLDSLVLRILEETSFPILLSRGTHPYDKILLPVSTRGDHMRVSQLAIDLARLFNGRLDALTVTEPAFSVGKEAVEEQKRVLERIIEHSELYHMTVRIHHREGNPIQETVKFAENYNLMVLSYWQGERGFLPRFDMALEMAARVPCSVMILPIRREPK